MAVVLTEGVLTAVTVFGAEAATIGKLTVDEIPLTVLVTGCCVAVAVPRLSTLVV